MGESEKGKEEKVEEKNYELNEEKRKLPGLFGEVDLFFCSFHVTAKRDILSLSRLITRFIF